MGLYEDVLIKCTQVEFWEDALDALIKQEREYAMKENTKDNQSFYTQICDEIKNTKAYIKTMKKK